VAVVVVSAVTCVETTVVVVLGAIEAVEEQAVSRNTPKTVRSELRCTGSP
jgi:hypothetical protein